MNTPEIQEKIDDLERLYTSMTGFEFKVRGVCSPHQEGWWRFLNAGFTAADLTLTIRWIQRRIKEGKRDVGALRWSTLIQNLDRMDEELSMAKAQMRNTKPPPTPKERVLAQARPVVSEAPVNHPAVPVSVLIENLKREAGMI